MYLYLYSVRVSSVFILVRVSSVVMFINCECKQCIYIYTLRVSSQTFLQADHQIQII